MAGAGSSKTIGMMQLKIGDRVWVTRLSKETFYAAARLRDSANATVIAVDRATVKVAHPAGRPYRVIVAIDGNTDPLCQWFAGYSAIMKAREDKP